MIPKQLQNKDFRFVKIKPRSKAPFEYNWQFRGYKWDEIKEWIEEGNNYGVIGGYGNLRILDSDNPEFAKKMQELLPKTLTIRTGNNGFHFYFISDYDKNHVFKDNLGELRASNYQVVGPGSIHPNGNQYKIETDSKITNIPKEKIEELLEPFIKKTSSYEYDPSKPADKSRSGKEFGKVIRLIKKGLPKEEVYNQMMFYSKWANAPNQYRDLTYKKAFALVNGEGDEKDLNEILSQSYYDIQNVLKKYCDLREEYYNIVTLWIIGTHLHKNFLTYPFLFFNAMKGSGKTRILNLISHLAKNGKLIASLNESVLFRTASHSTFCIDEFERVASKDKAALRELLNAAYKKGIGVERAKKVKNGKEESFIIEKFDVFAPICMANIWGLEDVLADRSLILTLERSNNTQITRLLELFEHDKNLILAVQGVSVVSEVKLRKINTITNLWNNYITYYTNYTNNIYNIYNINNIHNTNIINYIKFFEKVAKTSLDSRNLELFFPLFIVAHFCGKEILNETLETAEKIVKEKKVEDVIENKDVSLFDFISQMEYTLDHVPIKKIATDFKNFVCEDEDEAKWINTRWLGRALKRLNLIIDRRRVGTGVEVILNYNKAKEKIKMFKIEES